MFSNLWPDEPIELVTGQPCRRVGRKRQRRRDFSRHVLRDASSVRLQLDGDNLDSLSNR